MSRARDNLAGIAREDWWTSDYFRSEVAHDATYPEKEQTTQHQTALLLALTTDRLPEFACEQIARCLGFIERGIHTKSSPAESRSYVTEQLVLVKWSSNVEHDLARLLLAYARADLLALNEPIGGSGQSPLEVAIRTNALVKVKALLDAGADTSTVPFSAFVGAKRTSKPRVLDDADPTPQNFSSPALALVRAAEMERAMQAGADMARGKPPSNGGSASGPRPRRDL